MPTRRRPGLALQTITKATLRDLYSAAALTGILASTRGEPDPEHACEWAYEMGRRMALTSRRRALNRHKPRVEPKVARRRG